MSELLRIPVYDFIGPYLPEDAGLDAETVSARLKDPEHPSRKQLLEYIEKEPPKTEQQLLIINDLLQATQQWCAEKLGIDITSRLPGTENIHILEPDHFESVWEKWKKQNMIPSLQSSFIPVKELAGFTDQYNDLIARKEESVPLACTLQHEIVHLISYTGLRVRSTPDENGDIERILDTWRLGLSVKRRSGEAVNAFMILNEFGTEQVALEIRENYWPSYKTLRNLDSKKQGHPNAMKIGKRLVKRIVSVSDYTEDEVLKKLQWDLITGTSLIHRQIFQAWGRSAIQGLVDIHLGNALEMMDILDQVEAR